MSAFILLMPIAAVLPCTVSIAFDVDVVGCRG